LLRLSSPPAKYSLGGSKTTWAVKVDISYNPLLAVS
jgi:hypothetical protein